MTLFRVRQWGSADWLQVELHQAPENDGESQIEDEVASFLESAFDSSPLHVQRLSEEGEWEDL